MYKFDMHCHAREGSLDAKVSVFEYAELLKKKGFSGMLISDHDSYRSYRVWKEYRKNHPEESFEIIRGIEYDTIDAGHFLVIMPDRVDLKILEIRVLPVRLLISLVHRYGGILGPAHPYGTSFTSVSRAFGFREYGRILQDVDFVEIFNAAEDSESNCRAAKMAGMLRKPGTAGSDSHRHSAIGTAYTCFTEEIHCADDMIAAICGNKIRAVGGVSRAAQKSPLLCSGVAGFFFQCYNRGLSAAKVRSRHREWNQAMYH